MTTTQSDTGGDTVESHKATVRAFLRSHDEVVSKAALRAGTEVPVWYIEQISSQDTFYTSLNHHANYVASKHIVGHRATHDGFWRPEVDDGYLYRDELVATFLSVAVSELQSIAPERAAALVLRQFEGDSFDALERRLQRNHSFREALDYTEPEDVPDGTSLWRAFDKLDPDDLRNCLQSMCGEVLAAHDHAGEFVIIDGTHIAAWANTRDEIENGDVEGASWGNHEGSFYGYKVFLVVDAATELPVAITMETGKRNDTVSFEPLIEEFDERYDTENLQAALADAGFDSQDNREFCQDRLDSPLLTSINPRRSSPLATIKDEIKELFEEHGEEIDSPYDALEQLPQELLSEYGVEVGNVEETYIFQAINERMHRHLRAGVERVFSRLKSFTGLDRASTPARKTTSRRTSFSRQWRWSQRRSLPIGRTNQG